MRNGNQADVTTLKDQELDLAGVNVTSSLECSKTDCEILFKNQNTSNAAMYEEETGNCKMVRNEPGKVKKRINRTVSINVGGRLNLYLISNSINLCPLIS